MTIKNIIMSIRLATSTPAISEVSSTKVSTTDIGTTVLCVGKDGTSEIESVSSAHAKFVLTRTAREFFVILVSQKIIHYLALSYLL